jgi:hypothetical protein
MTAGLAGVLRLAAGVAGLARMLGELPGRGGLVAAAGEI